MKVTNPNFSSMNSPTSTTANSIDCILESPHSSSFPKELEKNLSFLKLKTWSSNGEWVVPEQKNYYEDLNTIFQENNINLGLFKGQGFDIIRSYLTDKSRNLIKLLYSKIVPHKPSKAQICFIHGLEDHSGRYLTVKNQFFKIKLFTILKFFLVRRVFCKKWIHCSFN